jgi:TonB-dependent receptor
MLSFSARAANARALRCGTSTFVLGLALLQATGAYAQDATDQNTPPGKPISETTNPKAKTAPTGAPGTTVATSPGNAIVVTGIRAAMRTSAQIKKNADTVVDSITATDIGAFPDKSVAEALQRIPGITVDRIAAHGDVSHFSAEPSGVIIRGLPQVRSEFNGRDIFNANSSRGLSWEDVTPELLAGVDAYKNQTADMIEGGIAGTISLRTRLPFDASGELIQFGGHMNYNSLAKKWTPDGNVFYSKRWQTDAGEFGFMGDVAYSDLKTQNDMIQFGRATIFEGGSFPGTTDNTFKSSNFAQGTVVAPGSMTDRISDYDRRRIGISAAGQWRSADHRWLITAQYLRSQYTNRNDERAVTGTFFGVFGNHADFRYEPGNISTALQAPGAPDFTFDQTGFLQSGTFAQNPGGNSAAWWGVPGANGGYGMNSSGQPMFNACYTWSCPAPATGPANTYGEPVTSSTRYWKERDMTQDMALNAKWDATDDLHFQVDGQYIKAWVKDYDITGPEMNSFADIKVATGANGLPIMTFLPPTNISQSPGGLSNPDNWYINDVMDHIEDSKGHEFALRGDGEYDFHSDWLSSIKFGARYADRKQLLQWSTYNWHNVSNTWTGNCAYIYFNLDSKPGTCTSGGTTVNFNGYPAGFYQVQPFGASFFGGNMGSFPFVPFDFLAARGASGFNADVTGVGSFVPICDRNGQHTPGGDVMPVELPNSCFTADEVGNIDEKTKAAYAEIKFGGDNALIAGMPVRGNVGIRFVDTVDTSAGNIVYPTASFDASQCPAPSLVANPAAGLPYVPHPAGGIVGTLTTIPTPPGGFPPGAFFVFPAYCYMTGQQLAFSNGAHTPTNATNHFHDWLPSFNLRVDVKPNWLVRFAASRAMSRPDFGLLKDYLSITRNLPNGADLSDPRWVLNSSGVPIGVNPEYDATAYNPYIKPITAWQFDLSFEHYWSNGGQFSVGLFHKALTDYIQSGTFIENVTNNGQTVPVIVTGPANSKGKSAKIDGVEVAFNTFFDFLPGFLSGFGINANYTYVKNSGVPNSALSSVGSNGSTVSGQNGGTALNVNALEGVSKHTVNLVGLYQKGPWQARLAYNWRSRFLVTPIDCCIALPIWQKPTGYLDGSIQYQVTPQLRLSLEAQNILNTTAKLEQQITDLNSPEHKFITVPESWNQQDRRIIVGFSWKMERTASAPPPPPLPPPPPPPPPAATMTCPDGTVVAATASCPVPPPPPPAPAKPERG